MPNDFILKPFAVVSQLLFDDIIHDCISCIGTSVPPSGVNAFSYWNCNVWNIHDRIHVGVSCL